MSSLSGPWSILIPEFQATRPSITSNTEIGNSICPSINPGPRDLACQFLDQHLICCPSINTDLRRHPKCCPSINTDLRRHPKCCLSINTDLRWHPKCCPSINTDLRRHPICCPSINTDSRGPILIPESQAASLYSDTDLRVTIWPVLLSVRVPETQPVLCSTHNDRIHVTTKIQTACIFANTDQVSETWPARPSINNGPNCLIRLPPGSPSWYIWYYQWDTPATNYRFRDHFK